MDATDGRSGGVGRRTVLAALGTAATAAGGCLGVGGDAPATPTDHTPTPLSGTIHAAGSSTVYPLTVAVGDRFSERHPEVTVSVSPTGTGGGFADFFCPGKAPINNASRAISDDERDECAENGVEPLRLQVATDAITVVVNSDADWVDCVSPAELAAIWRADGAERWSDLRDEWPDEPFELYGPTDASGTYDYFSAAVLDGEEHRDDYDGTEHDSNIAANVSRTKYGIGYFGFAYYVQNADEIKALAVDDGDCVTPSLETARTGAYTPLSRPLFVYVNERALSRRLIREFCRFYVETAATDFVADVGYVPVSDEQARANRRKLDDAVDAATSDDADNRGLDRDRGSRTMA